MANDDDDGVADATVFAKLPDLAAGAFAEDPSRSRLVKWNLAPNTHVVRFRYTKPFHKMDPQGFLRDFFSSERVREHFVVIDASGARRTLAELGLDRARGGRCVDVKFAPTPCAATSMAHFDALESQDAPNPIVRAGTEYIHKCIDDVVRGFPVCDLLRDFLLRGDESENASLWTDAQRDEFVARVFRHLAIGGSMCQYEDTLGAYLETTKAVYKTLVRARKDASSGGNGGEGEPAAVVATDVYEVTGASFASDVGAEAGEGTSLALFPRISEQNWCYLCVDARRRHVTVWYHAFVPYW